jgi:hypothetical protein
LGSATGKTGVRHAREGTTFGYCREVKFR